MGIKRHTPEEIVTKLRQVEVLVGQGMQWEHFQKITGTFLGYGKAFVVMGGTVINSMEG